MRSEDYLSHPCYHAESGCIVHVYGGGGCSTCGKPRPDGVSYVSLRNIDGRIAVLCDICREKTFAPDTTDINALMALTSDFVFDHRRCMEGLGDTP